MRARRSLIEGWKVATGAARTKIGSPFVTESAAGRSGDHAEPGRRHDRQRHLPSWCSPSCRPWPRRRHSAGTSVRRAGWCLCQNSRRLTGRPPDSPPFACGHRDPCRGARQTLVLDLCREKLWRARNMTGRQSFCLEPVRACQAALRAFQTASVSAGLRRRTGPMCRSGHPVGKFSRSVTVGVAELCL
jgi:hypothetical protein